MVGKDMTTGKCEAYIPRGDTGNMKTLTKEQKEASAWWQSIIEALAVQQGALEEKPRVLTFDELLALKFKCVWYEQLDTHEIKACQIRGSTSQRGNSMVVFMGDFYSLFRKNYGIKYRCWTGKPRAKELEG